MLLNTIRNVTCVIVTVIAIVLMWWLIFENRIVDGIFLLLMAAGCIWLSYDDEDVVT